jgi:hypothetical protein
MQVIYIAVAAFLGTMVVSLLGWLKSGEAFIPRKFAASLVTAVVAAVGFAVAYQYSNALTPIDLGVAFLGGAGVDAVRKGAAGSITAGLKK